MLLRIIARSLKFLFWIIVFRFIFTKILTWQTQIDQPRLEERLREEVKMERPYGFVFPIVAVIPQGDAYEEIIILQHDYTKIRGAKGGGRKGTAKGDRHLFHDE